MITLILLRYFIPTAKFDPIVLKDFAMSSNVVSVTRKKSPNFCNKLPKNEFTRKMIDFDTFTKIA